MEDKYSEIKKEIEKINQRVKEYLWKKWHLFKAWKIKFRNVRGELLAR